jgi:hypothetical protein
MEYLFVAVIVYFILQAASNIVMMMRGGGQPAGGHRNGTVEEPDHDWRGPSPRELTGNDRSQPTFWNDVEDATWREVEE